MKKLLLLFVFIFAITQGSFAQNAIKECVYLKNGSIIKGLIIEQIPNESLKIETTDGSVFIYQMDEVEKITKEVQNRIHQYKEHKLIDNNYNIVGYRGFVDLGYTIGVGTQAIGRAEITTSHGYQINPYLFVGAGAGWNYYEGMGESISTLPVFADIRLNLSQNQAVPFIGLKSGYTFDLEKSDGYKKDYKPGFYLAPSIGAKFMINDLLAVNFSVGYTFQYIKVYDYTDEITETHYLYKVLNMRGLSFKTGFEF